MLTLVRLTAMRDADASQRVATEGLLQASHLLGESPTGWRLVPARAGRKA